MSTDLGFSSYGLGWVLRARGDLVFGAVRALGWGGTGIIRDLETETMKRVTFIQLLVAPTKLPIALPTKHPEPEHPSEPYSNLIETLKPP